MGRLTEEQAAREAGTNATSLNLTHRALSDVSGVEVSHSPSARACSCSVTHSPLCCCCCVVGAQVSCLSSFKNLERLDLGYNCLVTLEVPLVVIVTA